MAFALWSVGTRSPLAVLRAIGGAFRRPRILLLGTLATIVGLLFIAAGTMLVVPIILDIDADFIPIELGTLLVALALEQLIGNDLRRALRSRAPDSAERP